MARSFFEPEEEIHRLAERIEDFCDRVLGLASTPRYSLQHTWRPAIDVYEAESGTVVIAELPGVDEGDLTVTVQNGCLRIAGVRRLPSLEGCKQPLQLEIEYGPFERQVSLPTDADADRISAHFRQGVLAVEIPQARARRAIQVQVDDERER